MVAKKLQFQKYLLRLLLKVVFLSPILFLAAHPLVMLFLLFLVVDLPNILHLYLSKDIWPDGPNVPCNRNFNSCAIFSASCLSTSHPNCPRLPASHLGTLTLSTQCLCLSSNFWQNWWVSGSSQTFGRWPPCCPLFELYHIQWRVYRKVLVAVVGKGKSVFTVGMAMRLLGR